MKPTCSIRVLLIVLMTCFASLAAAQDTDRSNAQATSLRDDDIANEARNQPLCLQETGTRIHHRVVAVPLRADAPPRATDCATSMPGRSWSRRDIERTGAFNLADALRQLDPSIH